MQYAVKISRLPIATVALAVLGLAAAPSLSPAQDSPPTDPPAVDAPAQDKPERADSDRPALELAISRLLFDPTGGSAADPVWQVAPTTAGRQIKLIPLRVNPVTEVAKYSRTPISIRGAQFVGFIIPHANQVSGAVEQVDPVALADADVQAFEKILFSAGSEASAEPTPPADASVGGESGIDKSAWQEAPHGAPRLARKIELHPDGTVAWGLDRSFYAGELQTGGDSNLYPYKLDPEQLEAREPEKLPRVQRNGGESSRDYAARKKAQQEQERAERDAFRDLRDKVRDLPTDFREPAPPVIYAVLEMDGTDDLSLSGPAPLPWVLKQADQIAITSLASGGLRPAADGAEQPTFDQLARIADRSNAYNHRALALALVRSNITGDVTEGGPGYKLFSKVLSSSDTQARRTAIYAVANATKPTRATVALLQQSADYAPQQERDMLKFAALRTLFRAEAGNPESAGFLISKVNEAIADPTGPDAAAVLRELFAALDESAAPTARQPVAGEEQAMVGLISFSGLKKDEAPAMVAQVIQSAADNPVAAGIYDKKLLRGNDPELAGLGIALLSRANQEPAEQGGVAVSLDRAVPIDSLDHGVVKALDSEDEQTRAQAWQALAHLRVVDAEGSGGAASIQTFEALVAKAQKQEPTPKSLVYFILAQDDPTVAQVKARRLLDLLTGKQVDLEVAGVVTDKLLGSGDEYSQAIREVPLSMHSRMIGSMYKSRGEEPPLAVGLVADPQSRMMDWFVTRMGEGELPTAKQWAVEAGSDNRGGESALLKIATLGNAQAASAAAATLVINAGGNDEDQQRFAQSIGLMDKRTEEAVNKAWAELKTKLYARVLDKAAGTYQLVVTLTDPPPVGSTAPTEGEQVEGEQAADPEPKQNVIELGLVELLSKDGSVSLSVKAIALSMGQDRLSIRIESLSSLSSFGNADIGKVPANFMAGPLDLLPREDGSWSGENSFLDESRIKVELVPEQP